MKWTPAVVKPVLIVYAEPFRLCLLDQEYYCIKNTHLSANCCHRGVENGKHASENGSANAVRPKFASQERTLSHCQPKLQ